jgi:NAD(P)H-nitrite reductase large subunit
MARSETRLLEAPLLVASDGTLLLNIHATTDADDAQSALAEALRTKRAIVIGVALSNAEAEELLADLGDGVADSVGRLSPRFIARRRR